MLHHFRVSVPSIIMYNVGLVTYVYFLSCTGSLIRSQIQSVTCSGRWSAKPLSRRCDFARGERTLAWTACREPACPATWHNGSASVDESARPVLHTPTDRPACPTMHVIIRGMQWLWRINSNEETFPEKTQQVKYWQVFPNKLSLR